MNEVPVGENTYKKCYCSLEVNWCPAADAPYRCMAFHFTSGVLSDYSRYMIIFHILRRDFVILLWHVLRAYPRRLDLRTPRLRLWAWTKRGKIDWRTKRLYDIKIRQMVQTRDRAKNNEWITFMRACSAQYKQQKEAAALAHTPSPASLLAHAPTFAHTPSPL